MNVINWTKGTQHCRNIRLANILTSIKEVLNSFVFFSCCHVSRDNNKEADKVSKEGLQMAFEIWKIREHRDGSTQEFYHRPFIKWAAFYIFSSSTNNFPYFLALITGFILHSGLFFSTNNSLQNSLFWTGCFRLSLNMTTYL